MHAWQFMTKDVVTLSPDTTVHDAAAVLTSHGIAAAPVIEDGLLVGMVSEADLLLGRVPQDPATHMVREKAQPVPPGPVVSDVMTKQVLALPPSADAAAFATLMIREGVRSIPVIDDDQVVGIVSRRDVLRLLTRTDDEIADEVERLLAESVIDASRWTIEVEEGVVLLTHDASVNDIEPVRALTLSVPGVVQVEIESR
jgi:CBS domain-containing protein